MYGLVSPSLLLKFISLNLWRPRTQKITAHEKITIAILLYFKLYLRYTYENKTIALID